jgi:hypothetical protein
VLLLAGVALGDVDEAERDAVPAGRRAEQEEGIDRLVVTASSLDDAPSPTGPTRRFSGITTSSTFMGPDWLPRRPRPSQFAGSDCTSSPMIRKHERFE